MTPACGLALVSLHLAPPLVVSDGATPRAAEKGVRDAFGTFDGSAESANFVLKWGSSSGVSEAEIATTLDALERAWAVEIAEMGHPAPPGTEAYKFNVYVGDSGDGAPPSYGAAGYYNRDRQGYPYIVLASGTFSSTYLATTTAHEFYHAIQDATGSFPYQGISAWYWEATAMWIEGEVYPDDPDYYSFLFGFGLLPHLPLWYFDYPDTGALGEYHQYGAGIYPRFLTEWLTDATVVRDTWVSPGLAESPQEALAAALASRDIDPAAAFSQFAAHNAVWDYADGPGMRAQVESYERYYRDDSAPVADSLPATSDGLVAAPAETLPEAWGYNVVEWRAETGTWEVMVEAQVVGSEGSLADWGVTVVTVGAGGAVYTPVPLVDGVGSVEVEILPTDTESFLVGAVLADDLAGTEAIVGETWAWSYGARDPVRAADPGADTGATDTGDPAEPAACGCATSSPAGWLPALAGLLLVRRRARPGARR